jgi:hypothetical protein
MADRWNERDLRSSRYVWLPLWVQVCFLTVNGTKRLGSSRGEDSRTTQSDATHQLTQPLAPGPKLPHQHRWFEGEGLSTSLVCEPTRSTHPLLLWVQEPPAAVSELPAEEAMLWSTVVVAWMDNWTFHDLRDAPVV